MSSFVDEVDVHVAAGHGGRGAMSFRREKFVPRGGPNGGDGGHGGSVYIVASANLNTLLNYRFQKKFEAGRGAHGEGSNRTGSSGADVELRVPDRHAGLRADGEASSTRSSTSPRTASVARGRRADSADGATRSFATSTNRAPRAHAAGPAGRREGPAAAPEAAGRRRAGRLPERRQVDADLAHLRRAAEDRRLPVHHARAEPGRRRPLGRPHRSSSPTCRA